ncbi:MAG: nicotinate (nicotinamide) nucleotide adenylyltransferase [Clostridiales bacterium]|nr:nicotinate (nicotinamide) nucleotide adenylyltransferase [Clostridiales bacterium]
MPKERIGIMGGSFNPIHGRHLEMASCALKEAKLDRVVFLPTGNPPHKREGLEDAEHRYEMTRLAVSGMAGFEPSRIELERKGTIYTVDTLAAFHKLYPNAELYYIIGEDTLFDLPNWRKPDKVFELTRFLVCRRATHTPEDDPRCEAIRKRGCKFTFLSLPPRDVSSTAVRQALLEGRDPEVLKPQVTEYIRLMGLYQVPAIPAEGERYYQKLKKNLSEKRLLHSLLVSWTARRLARLHGVDETEAAAAALLHDCAKCMPLAGMQRIAREHRLLLDKLTLQTGNLLHGPAGAVVAEQEYGITDPNVLSAIRCHTTGKVGMLPLDMIVFLSDKIEPSRRSYPALEEVRRLAQESLPAAMSHSLRSTLDYVKSQKGIPHPATQRVADWLERLMAKQRSNENDE